MMLRSALLAATILALPAVAMAQPITGLYVGAGVGANYLMDSTLKSSAVSPKIKGSTGFVGLGGIGYGLGNGVRLELEGNYRTTSSRVRGSGATGGGTVQSFGPMLNALYDFNNGGSITPYVGAGVGYEMMKFSPFSVYAPGNAVGFTAKNNSKGAIAAQAILGASMPISSVPGLAFTAEYRFNAVLGSQNYATTSYGGAGVTSMKVQNQYNNSLLVGLRYAFNAAAPAPVAAAPVAAPAPVVAPAPAPARSYLVFFDWDKADLTSRAQQIIAEAAQNSTRVAATRIEVAGHADKSGTPAYNQTLSLKRANNVAAELVRLGVSSKAISITAFGDTKPLVPTAAGVREPQNRRVEIVLK
jgi:outer membrane protein OmpA-like peptidoglycan-associated protein